MDKAADAAGRSWEAMIYISEAANRGYVKAEAALGGDFAAGAGVPMDLVKARYWLQKAADQGDAGSQAELGEFYEIAEGGPPDMAKAIHYFELSAAQHTPRAERDLGFAYELGLGVAHDRAKAIALLRSAAAGDRRIGASPARAEAYANALSRAGSRRFASSEELAAFVYPAPRQTQTQTQRSNVPNGCPEELNYPVGQGGYEAKARFCSYHPGCPVQVGGVEWTCTAYTGASLYQIYHDN
jgi:TPR repeat protein